MHGLLNMIKDKEKVDPKAANVHVQLISYETNMTLEKLYVLFQLDPRPKIIITLHSYFRHRGIVTNYHYWRDFYHIIPNVFGCSWTKYIGLLGIRSSNSHMSGLRLVVKLDRNEMPTINSSSGVAAN